MLGDRKWKILVLVMGILLAQAIDSPGRTSSSLADPGSVRRIALQSGALPAYRDRARTRVGKSLDVRGFGDSVGGAEDLAGTARGAVSFQDDEPGARRSQVAFREDPYDESRYPDDYALEQPRSNDDYGSVPLRNSKITFQDDSEYDNAPQEQEAGNPAPKAFSVPDQYENQKQYGQINSQRGYQEDFIPNQRYPDFKPVARNNNYRKPVFPVSKAFHPRYPFHNPYFAPPKSYNNPEFDNYYNPYQNKGEFTPIVKNGYFNAGFAPKTPAITGGTPFWKTRTPRVVFPYGNDGPQFQSNSHQGGTGNSLANSINYNNDNIVFRDQNFGLNDLASVQDIRNDFNLQDLGTTGAGADASLQGDREASGAQNLFRTTDHRFKGKQPELQSPGLSRTPKKASEKNQKVKFPQENANEQTYTKKGPDSARNTSEINPNFGHLQGGVRAPKTLQYLLPFYNNNNHQNKAKSAPFLAPSPPVEVKAVEFATERPKTVRTTQKRQDSELCNQGGTCEFFLYCWMSGGLLDGSCGGLLKGCCHRVAKAGALGVQDSNALDPQAPSAPGLGLPLPNYGPVVNDNRKWPGESQTLE